MSAALGAQAGRVARRRAEVRARILDVAERLMSERGVEAVTLEDITEGADIARRSFYHHFASKHELLVPIARDRGVAITQRIDERTRRLDDPAEVMATGMRLGLRAFAADPLCSWFVLRSGLPSEVLADGVGDSARRDLRAGIDSGRFRTTNPMVLEALVLGATIAALGARAAGVLSDDDLDDAVEHVLLLLGIGRGEAATIAHRPLRPL